MFTYAAILFFSGIVPFAFSFDKRVAFYKEWKYLFPAVFLVAMLFIAFDIHFTQQGIWGFNDSYTSGIKLFNLPLEECLFFFVVPYASIFLHEALHTYFPKFQLSKHSSHVVISVLIMLSWLFILLNTPKAYTLYIFLKLMVTLMLALLFWSQSIQVFLLTFLVVLLPFLVVNGILTGMFIPGEIVWYNNAENLGIRFFTIPVEDFAYAFTLIYLCLFITEQLKKLY